MKEKNYNRSEVLNYAQKWALSRNPAYYDYEKIGGDCTNFISQCIFAGCKVMNDKSWYYKNANNKSPSWTGVEFLYQFLINNQSSGPRAEEVSQSNLQMGDVIQLSSNGAKFTHSLLVIGIQNPNYLSDIYIATHSNDAFGRPVSSYEFKKIRFMHILDKVFY